MTTDDILTLCIKKKLLVTHVTERPGCVTVWLTQQPPTQKTLYTRFNDTGLLLTGFGWHHRDGYYL